MTANFNTGPLDVLYDADAGILSITNLFNGTRHDIPGIPTGQELVPHFTPNGSQQVCILSQTQFSHLMMLAHIIV
jgi:hypothetical protein